MKKDASPLSLRRPLAKLARSLFTGRMLDLLKKGASPEAVAAELPQFHPRDPQGAWAVFHAELSNAYERISAEAGKAARVRKAIERAPEIRVALNPYSKKWIKNRAGEKAVELSKEQHDLVRDIVRRGYARGARPEEMAAHLKRAIGLTSRQEEAVQNHWQQTYEETGDEGTADARADRYALRQLSYRTEMVARTENHFAVENGRRDEWLQARDDGEIPETARRKWVSAPSSDRLCEICEDMDGVDVGLDEPFVLPNGESVDTPLAHPN